MTLRHHKFIVNALENLKKTITFDELKEITAKDITYHRNELLVGINEKAILGIYCEYETENGDANLNLANKITAIYRQQIILETYNVHVPIFLLDPNKGMLRFEEIEIAEIAEKIKTGETNETLDYLDEDVKEWIKDVRSYTDIEKINLFLETHEKLKNLEGCYPDSEKDFINSLKKSANVEMIIDFIQNNTVSDVTVAWSLVNRLTRPSINIGELNKSLTATIPGPKLKNSYFNNTYQN